MMRTQRQEPESFSKLFVAYSLTAPQNETVQRLVNDGKAQEDVIHELMKWKQTKFINLVHHAEQAKVAMSMYSGDGIVTKLTPQNYTSIYGILPYVLPPFEKHEFECGMEKQGFVMENYPMLDCPSIGGQDVQRMKKMLDDMGLEFNPKDDKPDNIGRLPDGSLAILDGDAIRPKPGCDMEALKHHAKAWIKKIHDIYPTLYVDDFIHAQSAATNYDVAPYKPESPAVADDGYQPPWLKRVSQPSGHENEKQ